MKKIKGPYQIKTITKLCSKCGGGSEYGIFF